MILGFLAVFCVSWVWVWYNTDLFLLLSYLIGWFLGFPRIVVLGAIVSDFGGFGVGGMVSCSMPGFRA